MVKYIKDLIIAVLLLSFYGCTVDEVEPLFESDVNTRTNQQLANYQNILTSAEFGWKVSYQPDETIGIFNIFIKFNEDLSAEIVSDYQNGTEDLPTSYRVGISQFPELVFENFSVFHSIFLEGNFSREAEFEFIFEDVSNDVIRMRSKTDDGEEKSKITFTKASSQDKANIEALQGLDERIIDGYQTDKSFRGLVVSNSSGNQLFTSSFSFNDFRRVGSLEFRNNNQEITEEELPILITKEGFNFVKPFTFDGSDFISFIYNEEDNTFVSIVNGLTAIISSVEIPVFINDDIKFIENGTRSIFGYRPIYGNAQFMSDSFFSIFGNIDSNLAPSGLAMTIYFFSLDFSLPQPKAIMTFRAGNGTDEFRGDYEFNISVVDNKLMMEYVGPYGVNNPVFADNAVFFQPAIQELLDFWSSPEGFVYTERGDFESEVNRFTNQSGSFLNLSDPSFSAYTIWFR